MDKSSQKINLDKYETIVWDWNGTLLNDFWLIYELNCVHVETHGLKTITAEEYKNTFRHPVKDFYLDMGFDFSRWSFEEIAQDFHDRYEKRKHECALQDSALEALSYIEARGLRQVIVSAHPHDILCDFVNHFDIRSYFERVEGLRNNLAHSKVNLAHSVISDLGTLPSKILCIGDTDHDAEVASACGADCVLICAGMQSQNRFLKFGLPIFDSLRQFFENISN